MRRPTGHTDSTLMAFLVKLLASAAAAELDPPADQLNWTNAHGGPLVDRGDPALWWTRSTAPSSPAKIVT